ncbi:PDR/VanB family oxidoreductase [Caenimonas aquaedulcis]|uniref:Oxidoreductase n=1 Tax=Caenimonas aquaedulcis TaxID=2793270 RepID=A0A931MIW1_9BURK|nr:PDR/VanB family oxidoreductase [Caenimonas aquaedulcis]MBG9390437.1 oxidoreductase [Caenimonas aquaedulcis]
MRTLRAYVHAMRFEAEGVVSVELRPDRAEEFPAFQAGAHVDLHLGNGLARQYSLCNDVGESHRYVVGVLRDRNSRGGSAYVHDHLRVGSPIDISPPRHNFPLHENAAGSVLVAGGIGITPILCMARRLRELGRKVEVIYLARSRRSAAFLDELAAAGVPHILHFDDERGEAPNLRSMLDRQDFRSDWHYYACGPKPMLDAFQQSCAALGYPNVHVEHFAPVEIQAANDARDEYTVELRRSGKRLRVARGQSVLDAVLGAGVHAEYSCNEGICGTCETRVISGVPDHRDALLTPKERASNASMMICVSGCRSESLVLDL